MTAFVTGGSGFVGRALIRRLVADGSEVKALARSERSAAVVAALGAEVVPGDLDDASALGAGCEGCERVFHVAAKVDEWGKRRDFERINVEGTRRVVDAAKEAGVEVLVHVSTEAVLLTGAPLVRVDETVPLPEKPLGLYPETKGEAERVVLAAKDAMRVAIVRPRFVWGPDDSSVLPKILDAVRSGRFMWIGGGRHLTSTCHVDNLVEALVLAAEKAPTGERYFVTDGEPVEFRAFVEYLVRGAGAEPPTRSIPYGVAKALAYVCEGLWTVLPGAPPINRIGLSLIGIECTLDDSKIRRELGFENVAERADLSAPE